MNSCSQVITVEVLSMLLYHQRISICLKGPEVGLCLEVDERRRQLQNDVISLMVEAEQRGELSEREIQHFMKCL